MHEPAGEWREVLLAATGVAAGGTVAFLGGLDVLLSPAVVPGFIAAWILAAASLAVHAAGQRWAAESLDAHMRFEAWEPGVVIAALSGFLGGVIAVVGGSQVFEEEGVRYGRHEEHLSIRHIGLVAAFGPLVHVGLAAGFGYAAILFDPGLGVDVLALGGKLNAAMALSMLLPYYPLDGYKLLRWNIGLWLIAVGLAALSLVPVFLPP